MTEKNSDVSHKYILLNSFQNALTSAQTNVGTGISWSLFKRCMLQLLSQVTKRKLLIMLHT